MYSSTNLSSLKQQIIDLGPWHLDVQVTPEISTSVFEEAPPDKYAKFDGKVNFLKGTHQQFASLMQRIYPEGLTGKRFLDSACNCGAYSFWAKELGARECFGFDARQHWIDQANFLLRHRSEPKQGIEFQVCDLYNLPTLGLGKFDVTIFKGIFYHLPDPVNGLKIVADMTEEILYLDTNTANDVPDGSLVACYEKSERLMSGVYGLNWLPTGPRVLEHILKWMGFVEFRRLYWRRKDKQGVPLQRGRLALLASRKPGLFENFDKSQGSISNF
jgi:SAM-dependent methyltransferase